MAAPVADFAGSPTTGSFPLEVQFLDASTGDPTGWVWDFGDGGFSFEQNPVNVYADPGNYTVTLYASNEDGTGTEIKVGYIVVSGPPNTAAAFSGTPLSGESPLTVQFTDQSTNDPTYWQWDLGLGTGLNTAQNPQAVYTQPGTYTITLTARNGSGVASTLTKTNYVTVTAPTCPPSPRSLDGNQTGLPHTAANNIPYEIESTSYREQWVMGANNTVLTARVLDADSYQWIDDMVGTVGTRKVSGGLRYARGLPERSAYVPDQWCTQVVQIDQGDSPVCPGVAGPARGIPSGWPVPRWSKWRVTFEGLPFDIQSDAYCDATGYGEWCRYLVRKRKSFAKEYRYGANAFRLAGTTTTVPAQQTGYIAFAEITYIQIGVPVKTVPWAYLDTLMGCINSVTLDAVPGGYYLAPYKALFLGYNDQNRYWSSAGQWVCDLELMFRWNAYSWRAIPLADGGFRVIERVAAPHYPPFLPNDFANLLNPAT